MFVSNKFVNALSESLRACTHPEESLEFVPVCGAAENASLCPSLMGPFMGESKIIF